MDPWACEPSGTIIEIPLSIVPPATEIKHNRHPAFPAMQLNVLILAMNWGKFGYHYLSHFQQPLPPEVSEHPTWERRKAARKGEKNEKTSLGNKQLERSSRKFHSNRILGD